MIDPKVQKELLIALGNLPEEAQHQVAEFARTLTMRRTSGSLASTLLTLGGSIDPQDLQKMAEAIQEGCERIDVDGW